MIKRMAVAILNDFTEEKAKEKLREYAMNNGIKDCSFHKEEFMGKVIGLCIAWDEK